MSLYSQRNLAGGEISRALQFRNDLVKYLTGVRTGRNMIILKTGGMANRGGTIWVGELKDSSKQAYLAEFMFNIDQTYDIEFGHETIRFIYRGSYVSDLTLTITGVTNANPAVLTYTGTDPANDDEVAISGVKGAIGQYLNNRNFIVSNVDTVANTFELKYLDGTAVDSTAFGAYSSDGIAKRIYTLPSPYGETHLADIQYEQSADVVTIVHPNFFPRDLRRLAHDDWEIIEKELTPTIAAPANVEWNASGSGSFKACYQVTAVAEDSFEESLPGGVGCVTGFPEPSASDPHTITWDAVTGAREYNVYISVNGVYGYIGTAATNSFSHVGAEPDMTKTPPVENTYFTPAEDYIKPACVGYVQQRLTFANLGYQGDLEDQPEGVIMSRTGRFRNFTKSLPTQDDDAITFRLGGRQLNEIRHILDLNKFVIFTADGEYTAEGDGSGILRPGQINIRRYSYNGANKLRPLVIDSTALYVQARGNVVRDLAFDFQVDGFRGNDLSVFAWHLFEGHTMVSWAYQKNPHSIVWAVRDDGVLLSLTYNREHQIWGWTRHDTDGYFENVSVIPEDNEDVVYLVVRRTINGVTKRYVEKMASREISEINDAIIMDSSLSYDGRNTDSTHTMTIQSVGGGWTVDDQLALVSSTNYFSASEVGNEIHLTGSDGTIVRFTIDVYTDPQSVFGTVSRDVPVGMQNTAISNWTRAVDSLQGLWHLEGKSVSVLADGFVVGSPNNPDVDEVVVASGQVILDDCYGVIHVGLPYLSDVMTLNIDSAEGQSMADKNKLVSKVVLHLEKTRGVWAGTEEPTGDDPTEGLRELKTDNPEDHDVPMDLYTGVEETIVEAKWSKNAQAFLRQIDPLPVTYLAISPAGLLPATGG